MVMDSFSDIWNTSVERGNLTGRSKKAREKQPLDARRSIYADGAELNQYRPGMSAVSVSANRMARAG